MGWEELIFFGVLAAFVLAFAWQFYRFFRPGKDSALPAEWRKQLEGELAEEAVRSFEGTYSVAQFSPGYLELLVAPAKHRLARVALGLFLLGGAVVSFIPYFRSGATSKTPPEMFLVVSAIFFGGAVALLWARPRMRRITFDASARQICFEKRSGAVNSVPFDSFRRVLLREGVRRPQRKAAVDLYFLWRLYLVPHSGFGRLIAESDAMFDRDEAFASAVGLGRAIAGLMRIPLDVRPTAVAQASVSMRT